MKYPLRPYGVAAKDRCTALWDEGVPSCLVELPTGTGKTVLAAALIEEVVAAGKRVLFVAHRRTLIEQAARELKKFTGIECGVWMGGHEERLWAPVVCASKDTLHGRDLDQFSEGEFGLLVLDEAHHARKGSRYEKLLDWAKEAGIPVLGLTATPDRTDKSKLVGADRPFAELAYRYPIWRWEGPSAINDGWLVPINQQHVHIDGLDFSAIREKKLWTDEEVEGIVSAEGVPLQMASATVQKMGDRPTIVFCPTVKFAYHMAELIDRYAGEGKTVVVHGPHPEYKLTDDMRREREQRYRCGDVQFFVNVDVASEGADYPHTAGVVIMRPMKSRLRFAQCVGRCTRLFLGIPPGDLLHMDAEERRAAINESDKPDALVLGFYSNLADLKLWVNVEDVLGEDLSAAVVERARSLPGRDAAGRLKRARHMIEAEAAFLAAERERRQAAQAARMKEFNPAAVIRAATVNLYAPGGRYIGGDDEMADHVLEDGQQVKAKAAAYVQNRPSLKQAKLAVMLGLRASNAMRMTKREMSAYIDERFNVGAEPDFTLLRGVVRGLKNIFGE